MNVLPQIVKDYRIAVAEHVLCPGPTACVRDHASPEREAAEKLRSALDAATALAKASAEVLGTDIGYEWKGTGSSEEQAVNRLRAALIAYEAATRGGKP